MSMTVSMDDNCPHVFIVTSESEPDKSYTVELGEYPVGLNEQGVMVFNGACGLTHERIGGCDDFKFRWEPRLKKPENMGKVFRCKHIRAARDFALDFLIPHLIAHDPNMPNEHQT